MQFESLTLRSIRARAVLLKLKRPVVARIATLPDWPMILIDLLTEEGVVGRRYLEPYTAKAMRYLIPPRRRRGRRSLRERADGSPQVACRWQQWEEIAQACFRRRSSSRMETNKYGLATSVARPGFARVNVLGLSPYA